MILLTSEGIRYRDLRMRFSAKPDIICSTPWPSFAILSACHSTGSCFVMSSNRSMVTMRPRAGVARFIWSLCTRYRVAPASSTLFARTPYWSATTGNSSRTWPSLTACFAGYIISRRERNSTHSSTSAPRRLSRTFSGLTWLQLLSTSSSAFSTRRLSPSTTHKAFTQQVSLTRARVESEWRSKHVV